MRREQLRRRRIVFYLSFTVVLGCVCCSLLGGWYYFRHYLINRPSIGVFTLTDVLLMIMLIIVFPFLYLILPLWLAASLFMLSILSILYSTWKPIVQTRLATWLIVLIVVMIDSSAAFLMESYREVFNVANNVVLLMVIIGIANLWAQSGMKARDVAILSGFLAFYDLIT